MGIAQTIDVENILIWAYRDECVAFGDRDPAEPMAVANKIYFMDALGTQIDGGGAGPSKLPPDALTVEAAVSRLRGFRKGLVVRHATAGTRPTIKRTPAQAYRCDVLGNETGNSRHFFHPTDKKKNRPLGCYVGFRGDSLESIGLRWRNYLDWWDALLTVDNALRSARGGLKAWELADFAVPERPWENDPEIPAWLPRRVYLTMGNNLDTLPLTVRSAHKTGR